MARIERKHQKIFAADAVNNGVFGSAADSTKVLSSDIDVIQGKSAYALGWNEAVLGTLKFPALEEFQSLHFMTTRQIAYLFQEGIPAYLSTATYYTNSIVKKAGTYEIYGSLINDNTGNALPDAESDSNWQYLQDLAFVIQNATEEARGIAEIATFAEVATGTDDEKFVTPLKLAAHIVPTGVVYAYALGTTAPTGHVMIGGRTIGNAASGGTERANADTEALFIGLWNNYLNADLPIQDSSGEATTRGANAAADYAANKRLPTLDGRGRVIAGLDNMGGTPAGRLSGQTDGVNGLKMGASGGKELHTLTEPQLPAVTTTLRYGNGFNGAANPIGNGAFITNVSNNDSPNDTTTINSFGGNNPHNNVQPTLILPYIMKL